MLSIHSSHVEAICQSFSRETCAKVMIVGPAPFSGLLGRRKKADHMMYVASFLWTSFRMLGL